MILEIVVIRFLEVLILIYRIDDIYRPIEIDHNTLLEI